jgi:hypothetical protein
MCVGQPGEQAAGAPPPTAGAQDPNYRPPAFTGHAIKEDGFVTSVGNPELSAKFNNTSTYRPVVADTPPTPPPGGSAAPVPPTFVPPSVTNSPFARGRYVNYDIGSGGPGAAHLNTPPPPASSSPQQLQHQQQQFQQPAVFTPSPVASQLTHGAPSPMGGAAPAPASVPGTGFAAPPAGVAAGAQVGTGFARPPGTTAAGATAGGAPFVPAAVAAPPPLPVGGAPVVSTQVPFQPRAVPGQSPPSGSGSPAASPVSFAGVQTHGR